MYSERKIQNLNFKNDKRLNSFLVKIKNKPLNPNIVNKIGEEKQIVNIFQKKESLFDTNFLSNKKKEFVEILLPIISYENQHL